MNESALLQKKERLVTQSQLLRDSLSQQVEEWRPSMTMADQFLSALLWLYQRPIIPVIGLSLLTIKKPAWLFKMFRTVLSCWFSLKKLRR